MGVGSAYGTFHVLLKVKDPPVRSARANLRLLQQYIKHHVKARNLISAVSSECVVDRLRRKKIKRMNNVFDERRNNLMGHQPTVLKT